MEKSLQKLFEEEEESMKSLYNSEKKCLVHQFNQEKQFSDDEKWDLFNGHFSECFKIAKPHICKEKPVVVDLDKSPHQVHKFASISPDDLHQQSNGISTKPVASTNLHLNGNNSQSCVTMPLSMLHTSHSHALKLVQLTPPFDGSNCLYRCEECQFDLRVGHATGNPATPSRCEDSTATTTKVLVLAGTAAATIITTSPSHGGSPQINNSIILLPSATSPYTNYVRQGSVKNNNNDASEVEVGDSYANCIVASGMMRTFNQASQAASPASYQSQFDVVVQESPKDGTRLVLITGDANTNGGMIRPGTGSCANNPSLEDQNMARSRKCCCWLKCLLSCHVGHPR